MIDYNEFLDEEIELPTFDIEYADGTSAQVAIMCRFEVEAEDPDVEPAFMEYVAVTEVENDELPDELELHIYRYHQDPEDENRFMLEDIVDEEEMERVAEICAQIMEGDEDMEEAEGNVYH